MRPNAKADMKRHLTLLPPSTLLSDGESTSQKFAVDRLAVNQPQCSLASIKDLSRIVRRHLATRLRHHRARMQAERHQQRHELAATLAKAKAEFIEQATKHLFHHLTDLARSICIELIDREVRADPNIILERITATLEQLALDSPCQTLLPVSCFDSIYFDPANTITTDSSHSAVANSPKVRTPASAIFPALWHRIPTPTLDPTLASGEARLRFGVGEIHLSLHHEVQEIFSSIS